MTHTDQINDQFQQAPDPVQSRAVLDALTVRQLRALADLNHLQADHGRTVLVAELMSDRYGIAR